jgi:hypothetical protein
MVKPFRNSSTGRLLAVEFGTIFILVVLTFWAVRPLLEEWGMLHTFKIHGFQYVWIFAESAPMRPLHLVPAGLNWALGHGHPLGVAAATSLMLVARYLVVRWAVTPLLGPYERWVVASMAAVLMTWTGIWLGRFGPAHLSLILFFGAVGFSIRLSRQWTFKAAIGCIVSVALMLGGYQGLALCLVALPMFALLWDTPKLPAPGVFARYRRVAYLAVTLASGFVAYGLYSVVATRVLGGGYESTLAQNSGQLLTVAGMSQHIARAYSTAFGGTVVLPLLLLLALYLSHISMRADSSRRELPGYALAVFLVGLLPLFAIIYVNTLHSGDPDRVLFPVASGFVLIAISVLAWRRTAATDLIHGREAACIVLVLLAASFIGASSVKKFSRLQETVIQQTVSAIGKQQPRSVLLRDTTGLLGDVYTLLNPLFTEALAVHGQTVSATICTPNAIDRIHPDARRYPIATTERCEAIQGLPAPVLTLTVRDEGGRITVTP